MLQDENFFARRDTDLDWGGWLGDAKTRYDNFVRCHSIHGGGGDNAMPGEGVGQEQGTLDSTGDDEKVASEEGSGESEDDCDVDMSHVVRAALDQEISRLVGAGPPDAAAVTPALLSRATAGGRSASVA